MGGGGRGSRVGDGGTGQHLHPPGRERVQEGVFGLTEAGYKSKV